MKTKTTKFRMDGRPLLSEIRKVLPRDRRHLFLRFMPYSYDAPHEYGALQACVHDCYSDHDQWQRVEAFDELISLFDGGLSDVPRRHEFIAEIGQHLRTRIFSCLISEAEFVARLDMVGITLDEFQSNKETVGVPMLVGKVFWRGGEPATIAPALRIVEETLVQLTELSPEFLAALPPREKMAGIRLLRIFCLYGNPGTKAPVQMARLHYFRSIALPIWRALRSQGFGDFRADDGMYGDAAIQRMDMAIEDGTYAAGQGYSKSDEMCVSPSVVDAPSAPPSADALSHTFVLEAFQPGKETEDRVVLRQFERLRQAMPVARMPTPENLQAMHKSLKTEFPWAGSALSSIFEELQGRATFGSRKLSFTPTLLSGPAGTGKTRFARRLAETLGIESMTMSLGGSTDAMGILGTARGWSTGQPSPLLRPLLKGCATVLYCFDELDKPADQSRNSPPVQSALLSLIEPEEARRWRDPYLQVECDLSPLLFLFTCNQTTHLSSALRSRLRILNIDRPTSAQMLSVVPFVLRDLEFEWRLPAGSLYGVSIQPSVLQRVSSMRGLRRAVSAAVRVWMQGLAGGPKH